jgi:hypothetical protein
VTGIKSSENHYPSDDTGTVADARFGKSKTGILAVMMAFLVSDDDLLRFQIYTKEKVTLLVQTIELYAGTNKLPCINIRQVA